MSAAQHTPGPWSVVEDIRDFGFGAGRELVGYDVEALSGFEVVGAEGIINSACAEANARLIAAAPDMLAALKAVEALGMLNPTGSSTVEDTARAIKAAIAKAEGRS